MASFDIVSKVDPQTLDNAINTVKKEVGTRYDFRDSKGSIELDKKNNLLHVTTENDMRLATIEDIIISRSVKQGIEGSAFDFSKESYQSGPMLKKDIPVRSGIDKETSKKIVKLIKDSGLKVQASIMDDQVRVTGKKIDDLQAVISVLRRSDLSLPLQFVNMKA
jgi:cyclic-di-GMP-binding protein